MWFLTLLVCGWSFLCVVHRDQAERICRSEYVKGLFTLKTKQQDCMIIEHGRHIYWGNIHGMCNGTWPFFLDCGFCMLISWTGNLWSHGTNCLFAIKWEVAKLLSGMKIEVSAHGTKIDQCWTCSKLWNPCFRNCRSLYFPFNCRINLHLMPQPILGLQII